MKLNIILFLLFSLFGLYSCHDAEIIKESYDPVDYVNPLVGTQSTYDLSNGNTYPAIALPWGMNFWTPQTGNWTGWVYQYQKESIRGILQIHQPSPWIGNYGAFSLFPTNGALIIDEEKRASEFNHNNEVVTPYFYSVLLDRYKITTEVVPTERAAIFRFTFPENESSNILIDGIGGGSSVKIIPEKNKLIGYTKNNNGGVPENFTNYFVVQFDQQIEGYGLWQDGALIEGDQAIGEHSVGYVHFKTHAGETIQARVASSFISIEQAELNLSREIGNDDFEQLKQQAKDIWNTELNKVKVHGGTIEQKQNFYTALYRTLLFPRKFYEVDSAENIIHYSPYDGLIHDGYMFTDNGFWDTFRAVFPFFYLMYPEQTNHIMQGLVNTYNESGWLPEWASPGHRDCMVGSNSASVIAGAYLNGSTDFDIETAYEAILKNTMEEGPLESVGRAGGKQYNQLGFVPCDDGVNESVARTLEYAYDDFAILQLAKALKKPDAEIRLFEERSGFYKNVFDPSVGFMRGKRQDGSWLKPFNEYSWGGVFTEGSSWHYSWSVFHDPVGLKSLMGGEQAFGDKLDAIFTSPAEAEYSYYGFEIHEITEMKRLNMGQYAHGNQPIQHALYLYNWTTQAWKSQMKLRRVMDELYHPTPDGLCGDEDNGQTSAWYVFSAMGMYPVNPVSGEYVFGSPLFDLVELKLENGKSFQIKAINNSPENVYIKSVRLNGHEYDGNFISATNIRAGGELSFDMSASPNKKRSAKPESWPFSMSEKMFCQPPHDNGEQS
ncbi:MAG: GH92 family glycosyl hydrolase, partial [Bacteroidales bacterium]|nr:GH92 family glycosyl hydrolase [Bacteroidales bacterium]